MRDNVRRQKAFRRSFAPAVLPDGIPLRGILKLTKQQGSFPGTLALSLSKGVPAPDSVPLPFTLGKQRDATNLFRNGALSSLD